MLRRILAWITLAGFVLMIMNIIVFGYYRLISAFIYALIAITFLFYNGKARNQ